MRKIKKFDLLLLLFVIGAIVVFMIKFGNINGIRSEVAAIETKPASVLFLVEDVRDVTAEAFEVGDVLLSEETNSIIGTIEKIEIGPYMDIIEKSNGEVVKAQVPERFSVHLTLQAELSERQTGYFADGITEIKVNSEIIVYTKKVTTSGKYEGIKWQ